MSTEIDDAELLNAWTAGLRANLHGSPRPGLRQGVLARVAASAQAHAEYRTLRREASPWLPAGLGAQQRWLRQGAAETVALVALEDGAALPETAGAVAVEYLLTEGRLHDAHSSRQLPTWSHAVQPAGSAAGLRAQGPATLYRRVLHAPVAEQATAEARWWQARIEAAVAGTGTGAGTDYVAANGARDGWQAPGAWINNRSGVQVLPLAAHRHVVSMLVRFEAGAGVPDHGHEIDEDCLVLAGEMFLGDILLRAGDYQLAPAGGSHFGETSDVGATFFFHGALDSALRPPRPA
jgi:quercetin dioxygenase-like cupin family protein